MDTPLVKHTPASSLAPCASVAVALLTCNTDDEAALSPPHLHTYTLVAPLAP